MSVCFPCAAGVKIPDLTIWYGPDTYMGENLLNMLKELAAMKDEQIRDVHPGHNQVMAVDFVGGVRCLVCLAVRASGA